MLVLNIDHFYVWWVTTAQSTHDKQNNHYKANVSKSSLNFGGALYMYNIYLFQVQLLFQGPAVS